MATVYMTGGPKDGRAYNYSEQPHALPRVLVFKFAGGKTTDAQYERVRDTFEYRYIT